MRRRLLEIGLLGVLWVLLSGALWASSADAADPRIREIPYDAEAVIPLRTVLGLETMIAFAAGEKIQNVAIGDGAAWQVTPNRSGTLLFVKPMQARARTNMTVVTDQRSYLFDLSARAQPSPGEAAIYLLRFTYPPAPAPAAVSPPPPAPPERKNSAYSYTGARELLPATVFDDGRFTYFRWPEGAPTPAVFVLGEDGLESLVESSYRDGFQVVEQTARRFQLRNGSAVTTVINDAWRPLQPGAEAPRPHDARTAKDAAKARGTAP